MIDYNDILKLVQKHSKRFNTTITRYKVKLKDGVEVIDYHDILKLVHDLFDSVLKKVTDKSKKEDLISGHNKFGSLWYLL